MLDELESIVIGEILNPDGEMNELMVHVELWTISRSGLLILVIVPICLFSFGLSNFPSLQSISIVILFSIMLDPSH